MLKVDIQTLATTINYRALTTLTMFVSHFYKKTEGCTMGGLFLLYLFIHKIKKHIFNCHKYFGCFDTL